MICPLCSIRPAEPLGCRRGKNNWSYYRCSVCDLHFRDPGSWPLSVDEKARYLQHQNNHDDPGYRAHLERILSPLKELKPTPATLLDYGCGPEPVLCRILQEAGYQTSFYDLYFFNRLELLEQPVDIITSTEVFEHLHYPAQVMDKLIPLLPAGGILALMTKPVPDGDFLNWHYLNDLTHVVFYTENSFRWMAEHWNLELVHRKGDLVYFRKNTSQ